MTRNFVIIFINTSWGAGITLMRGTDFDLPAVGCQISARDGDDKERGDVDADWTVHERFEGRQSSFIGSIARSFATGLKRLVTRWISSSLISGQMRPISGVLHRFNC
jgi:hypothetical protein